jgi:RHS repeat-associated protein
LKGLGTLAGHGSVRYLTSATGAVTDTYDYDAFDNLISSSGSTPNNYLFAGEQFDPALGIYYNRARYYDQRIGRFWTMDTYEGRDDQPILLHKYTFANLNPTNFRDPSGHEVITPLTNYSSLATAQRDLRNNFSFGNKCPPTHTARHPAYFP